MDSITVKVNVRVYIDEMLDFFRNDNSYGTLEKPFPAESFYELVAPYAKFSGPLKNILVFENNTEYLCFIESVSGDDVNFVELGGDSQLDMWMITSSPSQEKWDKIIQNAPKMDADGKLKFKPEDRTSGAEKRNQKEFKFMTTSTVPDDVRLKFSILFEFTDKSGIVFYGNIDPWGSGESKPPPP
ncbi:MAG: hypothetical protein JW798_10855 [Prolixibacteraceae bacterium]|nr:hypothetical protein [Prolixibacteraceae bacterium]